MLGTILDFGLLQYYHHVDYHDYHDDHDYEHDDYLNDYDEHNYHNHDDDNNLFVRYCRPLRQLYNGAFNYRSSYLRRLRLRAEYR